MHLQLYPLRDPPINPPVDPEPSPEPLPDDEHLEDPDKDDDSDIVKPSLPDDEHLDLDKEDVKKADPVKRKTQISRGLATSSRWLGG